MKILNSFFAILAFGVLVSAPQCIAADAPAVTPTARIDLFNGKDFTGWTFFMKTNADPAKTWSIEDGLIKCTGRPTGFLRTAQSYHDYKVTVEWRFVKIAPHADNTGVLVHMQDPDKVWSKCVECQGQHNKLGDFWLHSGAAADGHVGDGKKSINAAMTEPSNEKEVGEWNMYQVVCEGDKVQIWVNGKQMNQITGCNISTGYIGIQSEGAQIEVRKIYLDPLK